MSAVYPRGVVNQGSGPARLVVVCGPTGTGKSDLAVDMAEQWSAEVVNADSMQLYRGMDIGTAKLTMPQRRGVPHHLLDILDVTDKASVAVYQRDARARIEAILASGRTPILVGGSGLYIQAVVDDIAFPATDATVRARLEAELAEVGAATLWARLRESDPAAAAVIEPRNGRRIVRALEVIEITGQPFTATFPVPGDPRYDAVFLCLDRDTEQLDARLAERVQAMVQGGLLDEVRTLIGRGLRDGVTAWRALGYRQFLAAVDAAGPGADPDTAAAANETVIATRRFVRKQRSWFRRDSRLNWIDAAEPDLLGRCVRIALGGSVG